MTWGPVNSKDICFKNTSRYEIWLSIAQTHFNGLAVSYKGIYSTKDFK